MSFINGVETGSTYQIAAEEGVRTLVGTKPHGPEPCPFGHSGTSA
jgi:hypothetical protein